MNTGNEVPVKKINHFQRYLEYTESVLSKYDGSQPFHLYLKKYFVSNRKHGSRDRKQIIALCYNYFRIGFGSISSLEISQKVVLSTFLTSKQSNPLVEFLKPDWNARADSPISGKLSIVSDIFDVNKIIPFREEVSEHINFDKFSLSFLTQPKLFVRIRPGFKKIVLNKLNSAEISFEELGENCLSFSNNEKVSEVLIPDKEAVIQDYNSQKTINFLTAHLGTLKAGVSLWDCCAASGGKSILTFDRLKGIDITVSDTRKKILENLHLRFSKAGIKNYHSFIADLSKDSAALQLKNQPEIIIADVPCSGSGTWARTPEQLKYFSKKSIDQYAALQKSIVKNASEQLAFGGYFLYITCSVFKKENEENVQFFSQNTGLKLIESTYLEGYETQADTLFAAIFKKNS
jgi:16S rRNA (cytosine967-C5)-methyltransferase